MLFWLGELSFFSWILSYGAEHLSIRYGAKFVGRTLLSIATTLPEIAIVINASSIGLYNVAIGSGLGSNILMMTLGLALMLIISTTRLSKSPSKKLDISTFNTDKIFLLVSAILSAILLIDGYNYLDGIIFFGIFTAYILVAFLELKKENNNNQNNITTDNRSNVKQDFLSANNFTDSFPHFLKNNYDMIKSILAFIVGTLGILIGANPFILSLQSFSFDIGISTVILAVIVSPIAGEMPEKISMMILARKGSTGASIAIANVLGSKILNNSLLLGIAVFAAMYHGGFFTIIPNSSVLSFQMILATSITLLALIPMFKKYIGIYIGFFFLSLYIISILLQFIISFK
jgi:cation:H+ antiporter